MTGPIKLFTTASAVVLLLASLATTASAQRGFSIEPQAFRGTDALVTFATGSGNIICAVTLEGTLHRSISKILGTLMGYATRGRVAESGCLDTVEGATVQAELGEAGTFPWHMRYVSFASGLPNIISIRGMWETRFTLNVRSIFGTTRCRYQGREVRIDVLIEEGVGRRIATRINVVGETLTAQGFPCPGIVENVANLRLNPTLAVGLI